MDEADKQLFSHLKLMIIDAKTEEAASVLAAELVNMFNLTMSETTERTVSFIAERAGIDLESIMADEHPKQIH